MKAKPLADQSLSTDMKTRFKLFAIFVILLVLGAEAPRTKKGRGAQAKKRNPYAPSMPRQVGLEERLRRGQKRLRDEIEDYIRDRSKKRRYGGHQWMETEKAESPIPLPEHIEELERKWHAVVDLVALQASGKSTNEDINAIGEKYGVGTGRNVRYLAEYVKTRGSLLRKVGSGAPKSISNRPDIIDFFEEKAKEWKYTFTFEAMVNEMKEEFDVGSRTTVKAIMDSLEYTKTRRVIRPFLTEEHREERFKWAKEWEDFDFFDSETVVVHIDEKCFYAFRNRAKVSYLPPGIDPEPLYALSKTQIPWVMFLGAVAAPRDDRKFDGKIGLFHVGEEKVALRNSKFHDKGDIYYVNVNMDGDIFIKMMKEQVIPAILEKCKWAKKVIVQMDSAGGHRIGESLDSLNSIGKKSNPKIIFRTQPTRSPDTNVLDLGIWNSMQSRVVEVRYDREADESMNQRIVNAVMDMWHNYDTSKLNNIFVTLSAVLKEIKAHNGGNSFKQPHTLKGHL